MKLFLLGRVVRVSGVNAVMDWQKKILARVGGAVALQTVI